ncbi:MAG: NADH-quinone oxidoreductase subunit L [Hyphomicrobium sp.]
MMYLAIIVLPLVGAFIAGIFGRFLGDRTSEILTTSLVLLSQILSCITFFKVGFSHETSVNDLFRWITSGELDVSWSLRIDTLTSVMLIVVTTVSSIVHIYSIGYMHEDPSRSRFFAYLSLFTFAMLMLVTSNNLLQMFFGWEGVGLASYLLIGFWYQKPEANAAAIKAFIVNRVGDFGFALGIFGIFYIFQTISFDDIFRIAEEMAGKKMSFVLFDLDILTTLCLLLFMGAMGKSAQFLLHTWLPDAMEGPTPVSALIHAATMVTAGVFMVARLSPLFELSPLALDFVIFIGSITAFFAATVGLVQNDIKRVIAYSTCSQLGYMFVACGLGNYPAGMFHLFTHAFFKALLFLGAGSVIHALHHEQDMRNMGGLKSKLPFTWAMMLIGTLSLTGVGIPHIVGFAGFHSKDIIIETSYLAQSSWHYPFWVLVSAALMTSFYSWRLMFLTFYGETRTNYETYAHAHESPFVMTLPLCVLAVGAIFSGLLFQSYFVGDLKTTFWGNSFPHLLGESEDQKMHLLPEWVVWSPTLAMVFGFLFAYLLYIRLPYIPESLSSHLRPLYLFLLNKWYFDELYDRIFVQPTQGLARFLWQRGDQLLIDGAINSLASSVVHITKRAVRLQTGYIYHYAFAMIIGIAILLTWVLWNSGIPR